MHSFSVILRLSRIIVVHSYKKVVKQYNFDLSSGLVYLFTHSFVKFLFSFCFIEGYMQDVRTARLLVATTASYFCQFDRD